MPNYRQEAGRVARRYGLDPRIFKAMIQQESSFNPNANSGQARGIAQFTPGTARQYGVNLNDGRVSDDLDGAARYLRDNLKKYGSYHAALSVYNSGRPDAYKDPNFAHGQTYNYVRSILGSVKGSHASAGGMPSTGGGPSGPTYRTVPGVDNSQARRDLEVNYFGTSHSPDALLSLAKGLQGAQDTPARRVAIRAPTATSGTPQAMTTGSALVQQVTQEAQRINDAHVPYQWGGGHAGRQARGSKVTPLDCSGAVSRVLGIDPRVSGQFESWGKPGRGKVTVYANGHHVLMEINGHFWGTSASNPGGGAGWIPRGQISAQYLKGFVARHA